MKTYNFEQGSAEWLKVRLGKFTASHAQAIQANGAGLKTLVFEKVAEILTQKKPEQYINSDMERGNELEAEARTSYELDTGNQVKEVGFCELNQYVGASPDGLISDDGLVEFKCPNDKVFTEFLYTKKVDTKYIAQMQMQMFVTDRKWCDYVIYNPDFPTPVVITRIERDEKAIEKIKIGLSTGELMVKKILEEIK